MHFLDETRGDREAKNGEIDAENLSEREGKSIILERKKKHDADAAKTQKLQKGNVLITNVF